MTDGRIPKSLLVALCGVILVVSVTVWGASRKRHEEAKRRAIAAEMLRDAEAARPGGDDCDVVDKALSAWKDGKRADGDWVDQTEAFRLYSVRSFTRLDQNILQGIGICKYRVESSDAQGLQITKDWVFTIKRQKDGRFYIELLSPDSA